jgi:heat shock protein HslJ
MKKSIIMSFVIVFILGISACTPKKTSSPDKVHIGDNSETSVNWSGVYTGITPCADCIGIQTQIVLNSNKTYKIIEEYLGKENAVYEHSGAFRWESNGNSIVMDNSTDRPNRYLVKDGLLVQTDMNGNEITGQLKDHYVLVKVDEQLVDKHWSLTELSGKPVKEKKAYIKFGKNDNRITGNTGCNDFIGRYRLTNIHRSVVSDLVATQKMCMNMNIEKRLLDALKSVDSYVIRNDTLILNQTLAGPLAKFTNVK